MDKWEISIDNTFAKRVVKSIDWERLVTEEDYSPVCSRCQTMQIWKPSFSIKLLKDDLVPRSNQCKLCEMFLQCLSGTDAPGQTEARLYRFNLSLKFQRYGHTVLSIYGLLGASKIPVYIITSY